MICLVLIALLSPEAQMQKVIDIAQKEVAQGGLPFAAIITNSNGDIVAQAVNTVQHSHDPTDHAEIKALRMATKKISSSELKNHQIYAIGHPCPMCLEALRLAKVQKVYFALSLSEKNKYLPQTKNPLQKQQIPSQKKQALQVFQTWSGLQK